MAKESIIILSLLGGGFIVTLVGVIMQVLKLQAKHLMF